jgi:16S rRNA (guanine527-N7)-methyltransferase
MDIILKYFPYLSDDQVEKFKRLGPLFLEWNEKINCISRKDTEHFYERHVLHSLGIAKIMRFEPGTRILDIGTGGGFPGIPLAIMFPEASFLMVDSIGKKILVVNEIIAALNLQNAQAKHLRAEKVHEKFEFIVSRAVTALPAFLPWTNGKFSQTQKNKLPNGILYLKGGDLSDELKGIKRAIQEFELKDHFTEEFFETKKVVYVKMT